MFYPIYRNRGGAAVPQEPVNALLYRVAFDLLRRLVIDRGEETHREPKPEPALHPAHPIRPALQRLGRPRQ